MVKLRGHHLVCLHFFRGEGYGRGFVENLIRVIEAAGSGGVDIVDGGDDVCSACPDFEGGTCGHRPGMEEKVRKLDSLAIDLLRPGSGRIGWNAVKAKLPLILPDWRRGACHSCEWLRVCEKTYLWQSIP